MSKAPPPALTVNIHVGAPRDLHQRLKIVCAKKSVKLKEYVLGELAAAVARDEKALR